MLYFILQWVYLNRGLHNDEWCCILSEKLNDSATPGLYYVNYYDAWLNFSYASCPSWRGGLAPYSLWAPEQPDNAEGLEPCVALRLCGGCPEQGLHDVTCWTRRRVVCQVSGGTGWQTEWRDYKATLSWQQRICSGNC